MRPSPEVERLLPGEEEVAFYEEHGYYVTPKVLPDDVIDAADAAIRGAEVTGRASATGVFLSVVALGTGSLATATRFATRNTPRSQNREIRALDRTGHLCRRQPPLARHGVDAENIESWFPGDMES